jgi:hypothetical protein
MNWTELLWPSFRFSAVQRVIQRRILTATGPALPHAPLKSFAIVP